MKKVLPTRRPYLKEQIGRYKGIFSLPYQVKRNQAFKNNTTGSKHVKYIEMF